MKYIGNLLLVLLILALVVAAGGCGAKFVLSSLEVSPGVCLAGETVTVSATLTYNGKVEGEYTAELLVDEIVEQTQALTIEPESSQPISFTLTKDEPGAYVVQLGEFTAPLTVLEASNFKLSPSEVEVDEIVTVNADLRNVADTEATYHCCLLCQGESVASQDITLAGGATEAVVFTLSQSTPGMYEVQLGNLSASFKVLKPAEFEVTSFEIIPNPVRVGGETSVILIVKNAGDLAGTYSTTLLVDGVAGETWEVALVGGATEMMSCALPADAPGHYNIEAGGQEAVLRVWQPPATGTFFVRHQRGSAALEIDNRFYDLDIVAVMTKVEDPDTPWIAFYVRAGDKFTARRIAHGHYFVFLALGQEWDDDELKFLTGATYHKVEDELEFVSTAERKTTWIFNLGPEALGGLIGEVDFPSLK